MADDTKDKVTAYNREYYQKHKEEIKARRKEKYKTDPVYREILKRRSIERKRQMKRPPKRKRESFKFFTIDVGGKEVTVKMYTITQLAKAMGRQVKTIRVWEKRGIFPAALYRSSGGASGIRLYTEFQIKMIIRIFRKTLIEEGEKGPEMMAHRIGQTKFPERIKKLWLDYPLGIDPNDLENSK